VETVALERGATEPTSWEIYFRPPLDRAPSRVIEFSAHSSLSRRFDRKRHAAAESSFATSHFRQASTRFSSIRFCLAIAF